MSSLGDFLRDDTRKQIISDQIQPGAVFFLFEEYAKKEKFVIVLGVDSGCIMVGMLYINSEINPNVIRRPDQKELQFKLKCADYSFLHHDSYINTSFILKKEHGSLVGSIVERGGRCVGNINERDFGNLRSIMTVSKIISRADKVDFGLI